MKKITLKEITNNIDQYDAIVVGAGFAGTTVANLLAKENKKVLIIEKKNHIAGSVYDYFTDEGIIVHKFGPHIFHTSIKEVWEYIKQFDDFFFYEHRVLGNIDGTLVPVPFNFKSLEMTHSKEEAEQIKQKIKENFPNKSRVTILELLNHKDSTLHKFGEYVYQKVFVYYTSKQWGIHPDKVDKSVISRVPVVLGYGDTYFSDTYQFMPIHGFTYVFENMLTNNNIDIILSQNSKDIIHLDEEKKEVYVANKVFKKPLIYTGAIDELFNYKFNLLPYRSLDIIVERHPITHYQKVATVNYLTSEKFTRISEYKYFAKQDIPNKTIIAKEYSKPYDINGKTDPFYPINNKTNNAIYDKYKELANSFHNIFLVGRLAEYRYYNMDITIDKAMKLANIINNLLNSKK